MSLGVAVSVLKSMEITWLTCQELQLEVEIVISSKFMMENTVLPLERSLGESGENG